MTEFERIERREIDGLAWAVRNAVMEAARHRDEQPSAFVLAILAAVQRRAGRSLAAEIEAKGLTIFHTTHPDQAALWAALKEAAEDQARAIRSVTDPKAAQRGRGARLWPLSHWSAPTPAKTAEGPSTAEKTALAAKLPQSLVSEPVC